MDYKKKYLKYKRKYLEHKLLGGSVLDTVYQDIAAYDIYQQSRINDRERLNKYISGLDYIKSQVYTHLVERENDDVVEYAEQKNTTRLIKNQFNDCKTNIWLSFVRQAAFVEYTFYGSNLRDKFYIYPAKNDDFRTIFSMNNFLPNHEHPDLPVVMYDFRNRFIALQFTDLMMLDFDWKDFDPDNEDPVKAEKYIVEKLNELNDVFTFLLFRTDRGLHVFIINKCYPHTDLDSIDIMLSFCADPFYTAFSYKYGYCIRANPKEKNLDDRVVFPGFLDKVNDDDADIPLILSEDNSTLISNELYYSNGNYKDEAYISQLPKFDFESLFLEKTVPLHYFKLDNIDENNKLVNTKKLVLIGSKENIRPDLFNKSLLQYVLIQFLRHIKSNPGNIDDYLVKFEKGISDLTFYNRDTNRELPDTNSIKKLRTDIENIISIFNEIYN